MLANKSTLVTGGVLLTSLKPGIVSRGSCVNLKKIIIKK